ncbi:MAG: hypothetical protein AB8U72_01445, partial [Anaplasma ovis]
AWARDINNLDVDERVCTLPMTTIPDVLMLVVSADSLCTISTERSTELAIGAAATGALTTVGGAIAALSVNT